MYTVDNICKRIGFLIDNVFVQFGGRLFRQINGIPMETNCAPLLADLFQKFLIKICHKTCDIFESTEANLIL